MAPQVPSPNVLYQGGQLSKPITAYQPFKFIYGLGAILAEAVQMPLWIIYYLFARPNKNWSLQTCIVNHIVRRHLYHAGVTQMVTALSVSPGIEGKKWEVIQPSTKDVYVGKAKHADIKPIALGGSWYPAPPTGADKINRTTILHFHGGAFVIGDARTLYSGYTGKILSKHAADQVVAAGYRLASNDKGHFPAQLQDAITWYSSLLEKGIPARKIVISGDSAGGNLCLQLLRYIEQSPGVLPSPGACLLWSPWVDMISAYHADTMLAHPHYNTDYPVPGFPAWGANKIAVGLSPLDPWLSPLRGPFVTPTPLFIQAGGCEMLLDDINDLKDLYSTVEKDGKKNVIQFHLSPDCNHDVILLGMAMGLHKQATDAAKAAGKFITEQTGAPAKL